MRFILYGILLAQALAIVYLTSIMSERPFSTENMGSAYFAGCTAGQHYIESTKFTCEGSSELYEHYLNQLDQTMDQ